jgi:hypothetical protein
MGFKSVKLMGALTLLFTLFSFGVVFSEEGIVPAAGLTAALGKLSLDFKLFALGVGLCLGLIALQTAYCRLGGSSWLSKLFHLSVALSLLTVVAFPLTTKAYRFPLYPYSFVKVEGRAVGLKGISFNPRTFEVSGRFFVETEGKKVEGTVSFNSPLISREGFLWIKDAQVVGGIPVLQVEFVPFTPLPFAFLFFFGTSTLLMPFMLLRKKRG